jgi:hypothetical protein
MFLEGEKPNTYSHLMGLPVEASRGIEPASVATQLALLCSVLDRCATEALCNMTCREWPYTTAERAK